MQYTTAKDISSEQALFLFKVHSKSRNTQPWLTMHAGLEIKKTLNVRDKFIIILESGVTFVMPIEQQETYEHEQVTFLCKLSKPNPVTWYKDDQEVKSGDEAFIMASDGDKYTLTIPSPTLGDAAEYTVKCGDMESSARLIVYGKKTVQNCGL